MFGLSMDKVVVIAIVAVFVLGPERLPGYAAQFARLVRALRDMADGAKSRMKDELGPDFDDLDWKKLDPRQYDPRRIIREALWDDEPSTATATDTSTATATSTAESDPAEPAPGQYEPLAWVDKSIVPPPT
jgi:sec-independent protein translocase protein TatB